MEGFMMHRGAEIVQKADLDLIALPEATESYIPISHYHLADKLQTISQDLLTDYVLIGSQFAISRQGQQMFGIINFKRDNAEMGLSVAFRNSYDRSMSVGIAIGSSVFICDNLSLTGQVAIMKKHTKGVWNVLEDLAISTLYKSQKNYDQIIEDSERLKALPVPTDEAFKMMGLLYGKDIVSPRQLTVLRDEWLKPSHQEFEGRNKWNFYMALSEALKSTPPISIMEKTITGYQAVIDW